MASIKNDLACLLKLQEHDKELDTLRAQLAQIPEDIEAMRAQVSEEKAALERANEKAKGAQARKKEKELEMAGKEESIKKHEAELNSVKTNEAFKALLKEIEEAKVKAGELETEIIELLDDIDVVVADVKAAKEVLAKAEGENNKKIAILNERQAGLEVQLQAGEGKRAGFAEGVSESFLTLYDKTRERRGGIALSEVVGGACVACHVAVAPQVLVDIKKAVKIVMCDSCQRVLYQPAAEKPAETEAEAPTGAEAGA